MMLNGNESLGFVETSSLVAAIEAADAMGKAANVRLETAHKPGGGRVCVFVHGDLASCQAAVAAGAEAAKRCGAFLQSHVLARPDDNSEALWNEHIPAMRRRKQERTRHGSAGGPNSSNSPNSTGSTNNTDTPDTAAVSNTTRVPNNTDAVPEPVVPGPRRPKKQRKPE